MRELAHRLLALEAGRRTASDAHQAVQVFEKLRLSLARFAGRDGFASLLRRALTLARTEAPALKNVEATAHGTLEGFEAIVADEGGKAEAAVTLLAFLLGLLVTFVWEPITLRLVRDAWPDAALDE